MSAGGADTPGRAAKAIALVCAWCGRRQAAGDAGDAGGGPRCAACGGPFVVDVDLGPVRAARAAGDPGGGLRAPGLPGVFAFFPMLPLADADAGARTSLGEGGTPLLPAPRLAGSLGLETLLLKDETRNPTGSFKDRMIAVGVARGRELGAGTVAVQSSGNVAAAAAAYAARAGLRAKIFVPRTAPEEKIVQAQMYGADVFRIDHTSPAEIFELLSWACRELGWHLVSTAALYNPFTLEGAKTIVYELAEQTGFDLPEWLVAPVGGGGNIGGLWRALLELRALGLVDRLPRLVGVQAAGCAPLVEAMARDLSPREALDLRWPRIDTVAGAIADDVLFDAHVALPAIRDSGGLALAVADDEALAMERALAATEGIFIEPASATALAALGRLVAAGTLGRRDRVACLLTGHGFKDMGVARRIVGPLDLVAPDRAALAAAAAKYDRRG
jgi:threonine synthase